MLKGRDIVVLSSIDWDFLWQGHQEIATRWARAGNRVFFVENTGVRAPSLGDAARVRSRLKSVLKRVFSRSMRRVNLPANVDDDRTTEAPVWVYPPLALPPFGARWQRRLNRQIFLPAVEKAARRLGVRADVIWVYLPTDTMLEMVRRFKRPGTVVVYYCIADFTHLTPHADAVRHIERALLEQCDLVFATMPEIAAHCRKWNDNVYVFPFGVNVGAFDRQQPQPFSAREEIAAGHHRLPMDANCPVEMRDLPRPIIGYVGGLHPLIPYPELARAIKARPEWSWVFVGAVQTEIEAIKSLPNVHILGQKEHGELSSYIARFDVGIVPYTNDDSTQTVVPTKINEYLAVGKPVVATPLTAVRAFNAQHKVLWMAELDDSPAFLEAIESALEAPNDEYTLSHRREVATLGDWKERLDAMNALVEEALERKRVRRKSA